MIQHRSVCAETRRLMRKVQFRGLRSNKKEEFTTVNEHFFCKRNEENGLSAQTLFKPFRVAYYLALRICKYFLNRINLLKYRRYGRPAKKTETSKARDRRLRDNFFETYCKGIGLDIGYGGDIITPASVGFDIEHGDATYIKKHINTQFDFVYSSHLLEHLYEPEASLKNWWKVIKPDGYLILYIPHRDLYEKRISLPSIFNSDHKHFFLLGEENLPDTKDILKVIGNSLTNYNIVYAKICDENYKPNGVNEYSEGEYSIEIVILKQNV